MKLKIKIIGLAFVAAILPVGVMCLITMTQKHGLRETMVEDLKLLARQSSGQTVELVYRLCDTTRQSMERRLAEQLTGALDQFDRMGGIGLCPTTVVWAARDQQSSAVKEATLPALRIGATVIYPGVDVPVPAVETITTCSRGIATVFQRMNATGDMLRVCSTLPGKDNEKAVGSFLPRRQPDGTGHPAIEAALKGETYTGRMVLSGKTYAAVYAPIWDSPAKSNVIGMVGVGFDFSAESRELHDAISTLTVGHSGYVAVIQAKGPEAGRYLISYQGKRDGENIINARDLSGRQVIQAHIALATAAAPGSMVFDRYEWKNEQDPAHRAKIAALMYFAPWDWLISAGSYEDDYHAVLGRVEQAVKRFLLVSTAGTCVILALVLGLAVLVGTAVARPLVRVVRVAQTIAQGNIGEARSLLAHGKDSAAPPADVPSKAEASFSSGSGDEAKQLTGAVTAMTQNLGALVGQVQRSSVQLVSTATEIAATSRQQEETVSELGTSTTEIAAAVREISATAQELAKTMDDVKEASSSTETLADTGRSGLSRMESTMRQLSQATNSIGARLAVMNEKAEAINAMVTTITKVADQTNLLSLNASIEAEKAGEYGLGFAVVAREIRRLADQTAVASLDIERTVKEMQSAVSAGVMEMDKFNGEVAQGVQAAGDIGRQMGQIIGQVKQLTPRFQVVNDGMRAQSQGAQQINEAMMQLSEGVRKTSESLAQFNGATEQLREAARTLQTEMSRFKV